MLGKKSEYVSKKKLIVLFQNGELQVLYQISLGFALSSLLS